MLAIEKRLELDGAAVELVRESVTLELGAVGLGRFAVRGLTAPPGAVGARFLAGFRGEGKVVPVLVGVVSECALVGAGEWLVTVREPATLLKLAASLSLRHCTPRDVLAAIENLTGLAFLTPTSGAYLTRRLPHFASVGTCRAALEAMGAAWGVADAVWTGLPDGRVYWGSWAAGPWGTEPVELDPALIRAREDRALILPTLPQLRPGATVRDSAAGAGMVMIQRAVFSSGKVRVEWGDVTLGGSA